MGDLTERRWRPVERVRHVILPADEPLEQPDLLHLGHPDRLGVTSSTPITDCQWKVPLLGNAIRARIDVFDVPHQNDINDRVQEHEQHRFEAGEPIALDGTVANVVELNAGADVLVEGDVLRTHAERARGKQRLDKRKVEFRLFLIAMQFLLLTSSPIVVCCLERDLRGSKCTCRERTLAGR